MHDAPRTLRRTGTRSSAGLAAAALVAASLTTLATPAVAADPVTAPLGFAPSDLVVVGTEVFAVGSETVRSEDGELLSSHGYVARLAADGTVAGDPLDLGDGSSAVAAAPGPDGTILVVGHPARPAPIGIDGALWALDPDLETVPASTDIDLVLEDVARRGDHLAMVGQTMNGEGQVRHGSLDGLDGHDLGAGTRPSTVAVTADTVYAAGVTFDEQGRAAATVWELGDTATEARPLAGADGHDSVADLVADPASGTAYVASSWSADWYDNNGITVLDGDTRMYVALDDPATALALSADGETLYAATASGSVAAYATDGFASHQGEEVPTSWIEDIAPEAVAVGADGSLHVADGWNDRVVSLVAPAAPANLEAAAAPLSTEAISVSWAEGKEAWELVAGETEEWDLPEYEVTVRDAGGVVESTQRTRHQVLSVEGLTAGRQYAVSVAAVDGAVRGEVARAATFTHARHLNAPSAVSIKGGLTVGSTLSVGTTGAWEAGTTVSYEWGYNGGEYGGHLADGPTVTLTKAQLGQRIVLIATGTRADAAGVQRRVFSAGKVTAGSTVAPVLSGPTPRVKGAAKVGATLVAVAGRWPSGTRLGYRWAANGKRIAGATSHRLKLTRSLAGKRISVTVVGTKAGHRAGVETSRPTTKVLTAKQAKAKAKKAKQRAKKRNRRN